MPRSSRRKSTPISPAKSRVEPTPSRQTRKPTRTRAAQTSAGSDVPKESAQKSLVAVEEEEDTILVRDAEIAPSKTSESRAPAPRGSNQPLNASRRVPSIRASVYNDIAPERPSLQNAIKQLTELSFRADEILAQLDAYSPTQLLEHLQDHESEAWREFSEEAMKLETERQYYCAETDFLQIDELLGQLAAKRLPTRGISHVYMKANLALFFYRLVEAHPVELHNLLVTISAIQTFPKHFCHPVDSGQEDDASYDEDFLLRTTELGIEILTQTFIARTKRNTQASRFDYVGTLQDVFYEDEDTLRDVSLGLASTEDRDAYTSLIQESMKDIMDVISKKLKTSSNLASLERVFVWNEFVINALEWVKKRAKQIDHDIHHAGGVRAIKRGLQQSDAQPTQPPNRKKARTSRADDDFAGKVSFLKNVDDNLDAGEEESQQRDNIDQSIERAEAIETTMGAEDEAADEVTVPAPSDRILREIVPSTAPEASQPRRRPQDTDEPRDQDQDQSNLINDDEQVDEEVPDSAQSPSTSSVIQPTAATATVLGITARQAKEGNKENSPPTRAAHTARGQPTASQRSSTVRAQTQDSSKGKRRRRDSEDEQSEEDDEDDFESDTRHAKHSRPDVSRRALPSQSNQPTSSNAFLADTVEPDDDVSTHPSSQHPPPSTQPVHHHHDPTTTTRPPPSTAPLPSSYESYAHANRAARAATATATAPPQLHIHPRPPQTRRPWTSTEIERLLLLMRQYGCAWSTIKKADERMVDPQLTDRNQVQLKDKARNMKLDFLKAEVELPGELMGVTISKAHKEMLRGLNVTWPGEENE